MHAKNKCKRSKSNRIQKKTIQTTDHEIAYSPKGDGVWKNQHKSGMMIIINNAIIDTMRNGSAKADSLSEDIS